MRASCRRPCSPPIGTTTAITTTTTTPTSHAGCLDLVVERRGERTALVRAEGHIPYAARVAPARNAGWARIVLVQTIAGPLAGDRVRIDVDVGRNAALELVGNAATLAYPSVDTARYELHVRVCTGGRIAWRPQPLILACGCKLESSIVLELAADATAFTREFVVLGRHGEQPGSYRSSFRCELEGRPLVHDAVRIDCGEVMSSSPAVLAGARAFASLALLGIVPNERIDPDELDLAGPGRVLRALAADAASLRARIEPAEAAYLRELATSSVV